MEPVDHESSRILALDFTKGVLVLLMVVYHWINLFVGVQSESLRYLRFLTPSFIFITGFLISSVYLSRYDVNDLAISKRLAYRGLKILGLFIFLNAVIYALFTQPGVHAVFDPFSTKTFVSTYILGKVAVQGIGKVASFFILVPISYLLLLAAGVVLLQTQVRRLAKSWWWFRRYDGAVCVTQMFGALWAASIFLIQGLYFNGTENPNLELLSIGLLGAMLGRATFGKLQFLSRYTYPLGTAYVMYIAAIATWNVVFSLQIVGVLLSLTILYLAGNAPWIAESIRKPIMLFGRYSLLAYIGQIAVIQLLYRALHYFNIEARGVWIALILTFVLTTLIIAGVDFVRRQSLTMDRLYKAMLA